MSRTSDSSQNSLPQSILVVVVKLRHHTPLWRFTHLEWRHRRVTVRIFYKENVTLFDLPRVIILGQIQLPAKQKKKKKMLKTLPILMLCAPSNRRRCIIRKWRTSSIFVFCPFSFENWHKLRKVYWIWQIATVRSINYKVGALKELSCRISI